MKKVGHTILASRVPLLGRLYVCVSECVWLRSVRPSRRHNGIISRFICVFVCVCFLFDSCVAYVIVCEVQESLCFFAMLSWKRLSPCIILTHRIKPPYLRVYTHTRTHTQPHAHCLYLSPPHFMSKNRSFSQWSLCFSKQAGMCMGLTTAHALKSFLFLTHLHPYTHAHAPSEQSIQGADGSQCIWDKRPCALRQLTGNRAHWHAGSASLPVQESKPHPIESWEVVSSQSMTAMSSLHPYILSPPSGEVNLRLTINTTQSNVTELVVVEQVCGLRMDC